MEVPMKRALKIIGIVIVVLVVIVLALPFLINVNDFRPRVESELTNALGRKVSIGNLSLSLWSGSLAADDIAIADDPAFGNTPFIRAKSLDVGVEMMPLIFSKTLHITDLTLTQPQVTLLRARSGRWNFSTIGKAAPQTNAAPAKQAAAPASTEKSSSPAESNSDQSFQQNLSVGKLSIKDGVVSIGDTSNASKARVYKNVNVTVRNFAFSSQFPFTLSADLPGGGTVKLDGNAGPINPSDAAATPLQAKLN